MSNAGGAASLFGTLWCYFRLDFIEKDVATNSSNSSVMFAHKKG
jgi:hypothetical protein